MRAPDLFMVLTRMRPEHTEYINGMFVPLMYHLEQKVIHELLHRDLEVDSDNLLIPPTHDELYWKNILPYVDLGVGNVEMYREGRALFLEAWENLRRRIFLQNGEFEVAPKGEDWWLEWT